MITAYNIFLAILKDTKNSNTLFTYLNNVVKPPYDYSDLLRWQWAQSVSALDKLIHDLIRIGMINTFNGLRQPTPKYLAFTLDMSTLLQIKETPLLATSLFESQIIQKLGYQSFQDPNKISDGLSLIWPDQNKWRCISDKLGLAEEFTKIKLKNVAIRRNQIVHEGDYSSALLQRQSVNYADVEDVIQFIAALGGAIYELVK